MLLLDLYKAIYFNVRFIDSYWNPRIVHLMHSQLLTIIITKNKNLYNICFQLLAFKLGRKINPTSYSNWLTDYRLVYSCTSR